MNISQWETFFLQLQWSLTHSHLETLCWRHCRSNWWILKIFLYFFSSPQPKKAWRHHPSRQSWPIKGNFKVSVFACPVEWSVHLSCLSFSGFALQLVTWWLVFTVQKVRGIFQLKGSAFFDFFFFFWGNSADSQMSHNYAIKLKQIIKKPLNSTEFVNLVCARQEFSSPRYHLPFRRFNSQLPTCHFKPGGFQEAPHSLPLHYDTTGHVVWCRYQQIPVARRY